MRHPVRFGRLRGGASSRDSSPPAHHAQVTRRIFAGQPGAERDLALLNTGAAIYAGGRAETLAEGVQVAAEAVDSGASQRTLDAFVELTRSS